MQESITINADYADMNRDGVVAVSKLFSWSQMCRHKSFQSGLLREFLDLTGGTLIVKAQAYGFDNSAKGQIGFRTQIFLTQRVVSIGKTSFVLRVDFHIVDPNGTINPRFAYGYTAAVSVTAGKVSEIPCEILVKLKQDFIEDAGAKSLRAITEVFESIRDRPRECLLKVLLRSSDEDTNFHVNQAVYPALFEDAIRKYFDGGTNEDTAPDSISVDYVKETKRGMKCDLAVNRIDANSLAVELIYDGIVHCRGIARWNKEASSL